MEHNGRDRVEDALCGGTDVAEIDVWIRTLRAAEPAPMDLLLLADPSVDVIESYLSRSIVYVAERVPSDIIGVCAVLPTRPRTMEIVNVAVSEAWQQRGIGQRMLRAVMEDVCRKHRVSRLEIATGNSSFSQLRLYQKLGFRMSHIEHDFFVQNYAEPIFENGLQCRDLVHLWRDVTPFAEHSEAR